MKKLGLVVATALAVAAIPAHAGKVLDGIKSKGQIVCGVINTRS